jgi:nucleoside-diphosphate-sugar epimerase
MEFLWDKDLKIHTVHVRDVVAAIWHLLLNGTVGEVYNLADDNDTGKTFLENINNYSCRSRNHLQTFRGHLQD